jgi:hypothetical protein
MKKLRLVVVWLVVLTAIGWGIGLAADEATDPGSASITLDQLGLVGTNMTSLGSLTDPQLEAFLNVLNATPTISEPDLPKNGTFWSLGHYGEPPLPGDLSGAAAWRLEDGSFLLDDKGVKANVVKNGSRGSKTTEGAGSFVAAVSGPPSFTDTNSTSTNFEAADISFLNYIPYGTNLYIAQVVFQGGYVSGILSNTTADTEYQLEYTTNLLTPWQISDWYVYGSEVTNWTAWSVPAISSNNLFLRVLNWASEDGSGLPAWWEEFYGLTNVDAYALDPAGDGYTIYQKYVLGLNPKAWTTPVAPQNFTAVYNANNDSTLLHWQPSPGPVTGYTVQKTDWSGNTINYPLAATNTSLTDDNTLNGSFATEAFSVEANYSRGNSAWNTLDIYNVAEPDFNVINGVQGHLTLVLYDLPKDLSAVRVYRTSNDLGGIWPVFGGGNGAIVFPADFPDGYFDIPAAIITNGIVPIPAAQVYSFGEYTFTVQFIESNGVTSMMGYGEGSDYDNYVFLDGRAQLKDNLRFKLRAASDNAQFEIYPTLEPTNYVYAAFAKASGQFQPFSDNNHFRNLLYNANNLVKTPTDGQYVCMPNTGAQFMGSYFDYMNGAYAAHNDLQIPSPEYDNEDGFPKFITTNYPVPVPGSWLSASESQWFVQISDLLFGGLPASYKNYWGLSYSSQLDVIYTNNQFHVVNQSPGASPLSGPGMTYYNISQPVFQAYGYYFAHPGIDPLPEDNVADASQPSLRPNIFSVTNKTPPYLFVALGNTLPLSGYAKLAVQNGTPGLFGYLGQYFDQAYFATNGIATGTNSGILSPYGDFFATQPGQAALVTMPDVDTGARGTCIVHCVSIVLDKNHDGTMDGSFNGPDATSQASPMVWWINDDYDYSGASWNLGQDLQSGWYYNDGYQRKIDSQRDLEDYARLWICGMPALTNGNYQVTLSWANVSSGNPTINLFDTVETNGGIGYLTNLVTATAEAYNYGIWGENRSAIATISPGQPFTIPASYFTNAGDKHFLFDGAITNGAGELMLTIADGNGNTIAQTGAWLDLHHIDDFFEQAVITNNMSGAKSNWTSKVEIVQPAVSSALGDDQDLIVLVHGINVKPWDCVNDAETVCKRLYWAGYHGKFAEVEWPCNLLTPIPSPLSPAVFNDSELQGYKASQALTTYLTQLRARFPGYRLHLLVHSQGNSVVSEAIRSGVTFDTYILTQGALPASAYDVNAPVDNDIASYEGSRPTPEWQPMGYRGIYTNFTGRIVNFYNSQDGVLNYWVTDQKLLKPSVYFDTSYYFYNGTNSYFDPPFSANYLVTDPEESRADVSRSRTLPIGQSGPASGHGVIQSAVDLNANFGFNSDISEHSAQWTRPIQTSRPYFQQVLRSCQIIPAP